MSRVFIGGGSSTPGPPGPSTTSVPTLTFLGTAGAAISADKLVYLAADGLLYLADRTTTPPNTLLGFTQTSALLGAFVTITRAGPVPIGGGLTPGTPYYLGTAGALTATPSGAGLLQQVGIAESATSLLAGILPSIEEIS